MNEKNEQGNLFLFPGSADTLSKDGLEELKNGDKEKAVTLFAEALFHDSDHEEASYGLLLAYAETGRLQEGSAWAEKMMESGFGNYFEVLQVYVSLLAQSGEYEKVVTVLEGIQEEEQFPAGIAEQMFELLELSRHMAETDAPEMEFPDRDWAQELKQAETESKMAVLQEMKHQFPKNILPSVKQLLTDTSCSPLLKSLLLLLLKDLNIEENIWIYKFDRKGEFSPVSLCSIEESTAYITSARLMEQALAHEDPVLLQHALELLRELLLFYYPFPPSLQLEALAGVLHAEAAEQAGRYVEKSGICRLYDVSEETFCEVKDKYDKLKTTLSDI